MEKQAVKVEVVKQEVDGDVASCVNCNTKNYKGIAEPIYKVSLIFGNNAYSFNFCKVCAESFSSEIHNAINQIKYSESVKN